MTKGIIKADKGSKLWRTMTAFERSLGGRAAIVESLSSTKLDPRQEHLLRLLLDPARQNDSLAKICADAGVRVTELIEHFREVSFRTAFAEAQTRLAERLPEVVEDVADQAVTRNEDCSCTYARDGSRQEPVPECPFCSGRGFKRVKGSFPHQQMIFEASELLKRGNGVNVNVQQNNSVNLGSAFFDKFVKATDPAIIVDVTPAPINPPIEALPKNAPENLDREVQADRPTEV